jgi:hypothetical protein
MKKVMMKDNAIKESRERFLSGIGVPDKGTFEVDDFQKEAIANLAAGIDTLVVAPTGSGKTYIATEAMRNLLKKGQHAVYTTPFEYQVFRVSAHLRAGLHGRPSDGGPKDRGRLRYCHSNDRDLPERIVSRRGAILSGDSR